MSSPAATDPHPADLTAARRRRGRVRAPRRAAPRRAARPLLPDARLGADAEDALQDALLRAWRGLPGFEGRSSLRSWLYRIATNVCLRALERRPRAVAARRGRPARGAARASRAAMSERWLEPFPDAALRTGARRPRRATSSARASSSRSSPRSSTCPPASAPCCCCATCSASRPRRSPSRSTPRPAAVYSALQRAHEAVEERLPERSQQATLRALGDERLRELVAALRAAWEDGDVAGRCCAAHRRRPFAMPPLPHWYRGREAIGAFLPQGRSPRRAGAWCRARERAARVRLYRRAALDGPCAAHAIEVLTSTRPAGSGSSRRSHGRAFGVGLPLDGVTDGSGRTAGSRSP